MKINELIKNMNNENFNIKEALEVKEYLPIGEKKFIADVIIYECTENINGALKVDSVQRYLSYVKYMILRHTNLEYTHEDYDTLCSTGLLNKIMECFGEDAQECSRILNLMMDDYMNEFTIESTVAKFLNGLGEAIGGLADKLNQKVENIDLASIIPEGMDVDKLNNFLNTYVK